MQIERLGVSHRTGEWADEDWTNLQLSVDGSEVEIQYAPDGMVRRHETEPITVVWEGAVDFEGGKRDFSKRYPELARYLRREGWL